MESSPHTRRVAVTGIGVIAALGQDLPTVWDALLAGKCGIGRITSFDPKDFTCQIAAEVKDFDPARLMDAKEARRNDRYTQFAMAAAKMALMEAGITRENIDPERTGVIIGSGIGGMLTIEAQHKNLMERGPRKVSPFMIPALISNMASGLVAIELGALGPNFSVVSACATGTHAIGEAFSKIRHGVADVMVAGGSEAAITPLAMAGFCSMKAMSTRNDEPLRASRPFDKNRDGFVMGEGGAILILEEMDRARARGAKIYCELCGYGASCDAFHITQPEPEGKGLALAMVNALRSAGVPPEQVDYINAHGTSTPYNDKFETFAIKKIFGEHARRLMVSSTKSMTGHLLGAAGSLEAAVSCKVIETGRVPPTINYEEPDPDCDLDYVPNVAREHPVKTVLSNNLGFGGQNAALLFKALA